MRKYGIGDNGDSLPEFGVLTKFDTTPPIWTWEVDGAPIQLSTRQLETFREFKTAVLERLSKMLHAGQHLLEQFCTGQIQAFSMDEILMGRPTKPRARATVTPEKVEHAPEFSTPELT